VVQPRNAKQVRDRFRAAVFERLFVRLHAALLLGVVGLLGFLLNGALLRLEFDHLPVRTFFVLGTSCGMFLGLVRVWAGWVQASEARLTRLARADLEALAEGDAGLSGPRRKVRDLSDAVDLVDVGLDGDGLGCVVLPLLVVGAVLLFWGVGWFIADAPLLLADVVFELALGVSLLKSTRTLTRRPIALGWFEVAWHHTWRPMAVLVVVGVGFATVVHVVCDAPTRIAGCFDR
jgi:hypothetical protein